MSQESFQLSGNASEIYENQKVPVMFGPLAEATLKIVPVAQDDAILDVACGTGILARKVRERIGSSARIAGVDLNESMISAARNLTDAYARSCEWHVSSVNELPFEDGDFSRIFCQQGFQFFPDETVALGEMKRVMRPGGLMAMTIWSGPSVLFSVMADALAKYVDKQTATKLLIPFAYEGRETLQGLLTELGFSDTSRTEIAIDRVIENPETSLSMEIMGNPVGPLVAEKGEEAMQRIVEHTLDGLSEYRQGTTLIVPQNSHLFQASVV